MTDQTEIVGIETKGYRMDGFLYIIHGRRLFQTDYNYFLELMHGNEVHGSIVRRLKKLIPVPHSEVFEVLSKLRNTINEII